MDDQVEVLYEGLDFGEGPRWHDDRLWVSDFFAHRVLSLSADGLPRVEAELDDQPSGLGWLPSGDLLVVAMRSRQVRRIAPDGTVSVHADLSHVAAGQANDMVVDAAGNAYVGNFGYDAEAGETVRPAALALVRPDGTVEVAARDLEFPNGSVITPDGRTLIVGESKGRRYCAFTILDDATLTDRRVWAEVPGSAPDGCALDADGAIWMADALGSGCLRVHRGGTITHRIEASQTVFACALGGPEGRTLHLITAPRYGEDACTGTGLGRVETIRVDVPGAAAPRRGPDPR
ncbi:SMP-30/gluconolactonase/LRE family protein [Aquihabitans sp. McL0605]|uniref:SMP-30/gluconolactonase/LRE family protein n=1 Tax=Aquihabitans sp. McL0605 TaxID=3415671 RepID=UPI003CF8D81A